MTQNILLSCFSKYYNLEITNEEIMNFLESVEIVFNSNIIIEDENDISIGIYNNNISKSLLANQIYPEYTEITKSSLNRDLIGNIIVLKTFEKNLEEGKSLILVSNFEYNNILNNICENLENGDFTSEEIITNIRENTMSIELLHQVSYYLKKYPNKIYFKKYETVEDFFDNSTNIEISYGIKKAFMLAEKNLLVVPVFSCNIL